MGIHEYYSGSGVVQEFRSFIGLQGFRSSTKVQVYRCSTRVQCYRVNRGVQRGVAQRYSGYMISTGVQGTYR
jgi:hypothetical protein